MAKRKKEIPSAKDVIAALKSRYPGKIFEASEYSMPWVMKRLPTGILDIDIALQGGFPAGGLSFLIGKQGVGCLGLHRNAVRQDARAILWCGGTTV